MVFVAPPPYLFSVFPTYHTTCNRNSFKLIQNMTLLDHYAHRFSWEKKYIFSIKFLFIKVLLLRNQISSYPQRSYIRWATNNIMGCCLLKDLYNTRQYSKQIMHCNMRQYQPLFHQPVAKSNCLSDKVSQPNLICLLTIKAPWVCKFATSLYFSYCFSEILHRKFK